MIPASMRALRQTSLLGPRDLKFVTEEPVPSPGPGCVLLRVGAAGLNFVDISQANGSFAGGPQPPYIAGIEAAGEVVALGEDVTNLDLGAHVTGVAIMGGAFAEYLVVPAAAALPVPHGWTDAQALGLLVSTPTALAALKLGDVRTTETVLVHAAAGGTGQVALRIAKHYGATVIASASPEKHEVLRDLGADHILDAQSGSLASAIADITGGAGVDLVLDSVGGPAFEESLAAAKRVRGRVVVYGLAAGEATVSNWDLVYKHPVHVIGLNIGAVIQSTPDFFGELMAEMFALIAAGVLPPSDPKTWPLADGAKALTELGARATTGRLALLP